MDGWDALLCVGRYSLSPNRSLRHESPSYVPKSPVGRHVMCQSSKARSTKKNIDLSFVFITF